MQVSRFVTTLFAALWLLIALQFALGIVLAGQYSPDVGKAHASVEALQSQKPWAFATALHYWSSGAAIIVALVLVLSMLWLGLYRKGVRALWWSACASFLFVLALQITGNLLPLSAHDVRTANIEANIAGAAPLLGPTMRQLALGGENVNQETLSRWFAAHVYVLPAALALAVIVGIAAYRRVSGTRAHWYFALAPMIGAVLFAALFGTPLGPAAAEADFMSGATPPMWYVLPLHSLLLIFQGLNATLGWIGAILVPSIIVLLLFALPFLTRANSGPPIGARVGLCVTLLAFISAMAFSGAVMKDPFKEGVPRPIAAAPAPNAPPLDSQVAQQGKVLFSSVGCTDCHRVGSAPGAVIGPNLQGIGKRRQDPQWLVEFLKNPPAKGADLMPAFDDIPDTELRKIAEYLRSLK